MRLARIADGAYYVPGGELLWLDVEGHGPVGVRSREAYLHTDGTLEPGVLESPVRTELHYERWDGLRVRPLVCPACHDSGVGPDYNTAGTDDCDACHGYGHEVNLHRCTWCGEFSAEALPCAPREVLNHALLLSRMHPRCAIEYQVEHVRMERCA
jgi:hypothetical protein